MMEARIGDHCMDHTDDGVDGDDWYERRCMTEVNAKIRTVGFAIIISSNIRQRREENIIG